MSGSDDCTVEGSRFNHLRSSLLRVIYDKKIPALNVTVTLGLHVYKEYLHWAPMSINITYIGLFGSLGNVTVIVPGQYPKHSPHAGKSPNCTSSF